MAAFLSTKAEELGALDAFLYAVIGFLIVISVLALLVGIFYLSGKIFSTEVMSRKDLFKRDKPAEVKEPSYVPNIVECDEEEVVAVISAAISAMLSEENDGEPPEFVVRRITRKK